MGTKKIKYTLPFVNKGKPFEMPNWTPKKHENALANLAKYTKEHNLTDKDADNEFKYFVIFETLQDIDNSVMLDDIRNLHPLDLIDLFYAVYHAGRSGIIYTDFREKGKKSPKK